MFTENKPWLKLLSFVLAVSLLLTSIPNQVIATVGEELFFEPQSEEALAEDTVLAVRGVYEVTELREENVKHFALPDGSFTAVMYETPVHTQDADGNWQDIDNRLSDSGSEFSTSNARIKFSKKITGNEVLFTLHDGNRKISMSLEDAIKKTAGSVTNTYTEFDSEATELQKLMTLDNLSSRILYADILNGVDLEYIVESLNVKENIIVKERKDSYQYTFTISLNNLEAAMVEDGSIQIYDPITMETVYNIPAGFMYDATGEYSTAVTYALTNNGNGKYSMTVVADATWINAENRAFPVCIDPSITVDDFSIYEETYIDSSSPLLLGYKNGYLQVGPSCNTYWKLTILPNLPAGYYITDAQFTITGMDPATYANSSTTLDIGIYDVTTNWSRSTLSYSRFTDYNEGRYSTHAYDSQCGADLHNRYTWNITQLVRDWYNDPTTNHGLAIVCRDPFYSNLVYRFKCGAVGSPIRITYESIRGVENYWSYATQSAGIAGTGYVNKATGNLSFVIDTLSTTDALFGQTTTLVYNQAYAGRFVVSGVANVPNIGPTFGYGIKMNVNEYLVSKTYVDIEGNTKTCYIWTDSDGTEHDFYPDGNSSTTYKDNDGLLLTLTVGDGIYEIEDTNHNVRTFTQTSEDRTIIKEGAILSSITDKNGNKLQYTYTDWGRINQVRVVPNGSSSISYLQFVYNAYGQVKRIYNYGVDTAPKVVFYYSPNYYETSDVSTDYKGYLKKIEFINENEVIATAKYEYDSSGRLLSAQDERSDYSVEYTYTGDRVTSITEYAGSANTVGQTVSFTYGDGYTETRTSGSDDIHGTADDLITTSIFDIHGRVTSTYSTDVNRTSIYGASSGEYETQENVKNNIKTVTTVGGAASNYIFNGGFEKGFIGWAELNDNVYRVASSDSLRGNYHIRLDPTPDAPAMMEQCVYLAEGEYTLSWDVSSYGTERLCMWVHAIPLDGTGETQTKQVSLNEENATDGFVNISLNITASDYNGTGGERFKIRFYASTGYTDYDAPLEAPYILIDNIMLEECLGQSGYSMVEFGNFEDFHRQQSYTYDDYWGSAAVVEYANDLLGNVLVLDPNATTPQTTAEQTVYTASASAGTAPPRTFTVSAMGRGTYQIASGFFGIKVAITYGDNTKEEFEVPFENMNNNWQFTSKMITTEEKTIKEIKVIAAYENNPGVGYFDNIYLTQIVSDDTVRRSYTSNGLVQGVENGYNSVVYGYDDNNNLILAETNQNQRSTYTYDAYHRLKSENYYVYELSISNQYAWVLKTSTTYVYNQYGQVRSQSTADHYAAYSDSAGEVVSIGYTYNVTAGSRIFGALLSTTNSLGYTTQYFYDSVTGQLLAEFNTETDTGMCYTYDLLGNISSAMPATMTSSSSYAAVANAEVVDYTYNDANLLQSITTGSTTYNFTYDVFGNSSAVAIGSEEIVSYEYYSNNGKLHYLHYGNGVSVEYKYDTLERVSEVWYSTGSTWTQAYAYRYNAYGQLYEFQNLLTDRNVLYSYDANNRMIGHVEYETRTDGNITYKVNTFAAKYSYDEKSQLIGVKYNLDYKQGIFGTGTAEYGYEYTYTDNGLLQNYQIFANISGSIHYTYDEFMRLKTKTLAHVKTADSYFRNTVTYGYAEQDLGDGYSGQVYSSLLVDEYQSIISTENATQTTTYTYTYDTKGNITRIYGGGYVYRYYYDDLGQLIREDNSALNRTYVYTYDNAGNRLSKTEYSYTAENETPTGGTTFAYAYNNASWGDQLTSYQGVAFIYDEIGNPEMYYNGTSWEFSWAQGRRLATAYNGTTAIHFQYNDEGIRTQKDVQGRVHTYRLDGSRIIVEEVGNQTFVYLYDADGSPIGMQYVTAEGAFETCWFEKNLQGDIVAVYNSSGAKLVSYKYDAWGNFTTTYHNGCTASSIAAQNPFRYRGCYYDTDLGMYYLQSRYYDPAIGRFINADIYVSTGQGLTGNNMYAYCGNNPVMHRDPSGEFFFSALGALAGFVSGAITATLTGQSEKAFEIAYESAIGGAIAGAGIDLGLLLIGSLGAALPVVAAATLVSFTAGGLGNAFVTYANSDGAATDEQLTASFVLGGIGNVISLGTSISAMAPNIDQLMIAGMNQFQNNLQVGLGIAICTSFATTIATDSYTLNDLVSDFLSIPSLLPLPMIRIRGT